MKIRKENHMKNMKIIGTFENHMNMNYNHKIKSYEKKRQSLKTKNVI